MNQAETAPSPWSNPTGWLDAPFNLLLELREDTARLRSLLLLPFFALWPILAYLQSGEELRFAAMALFVPQLLPPEVEPLSFLLQTILRAMFAPGVLIHVLAIYLPVLFAIWAAAAYMSEIFELSDARTARRFISQAAFHLPGYERLVINNEQISRDSSASIMMQIGGPGYLQVNLEYAAVFEHPDGTPDLVGPTADLPGNRHTLEGFERFRTVLDLRDQFFRIDQLTARTKEGVRVNLQNVQLIFSIQREKDPASLENPYPFSRAAVHRLVYHQLPEKWTQTMIDLVTQELVQYIRSRSLGDLLAAVGEPEITRQVELETAIRSHSQRQRQRLERYRLSGKKQQSAPGERRVLQRLPASYQGRQKAMRAPRRPGLGALPAQPVSITPRVQLSNFFSDFVEGFPRRAHQHGVSLRWINVGTFHTPQEVIPSQHIEAWQLNADNLARCSLPVLDQLRMQAYRQELAQLFDGLWESFSRQQGTPEEITMQLVTSMQARVQQMLEDNQRSAAIPEDIRRGLERMQNPVEAYRSTRRSI